MRVATLEQEITAVIDGESSTEVREVGHVFVAPGRLIRLHLPNSHYKWTGDLGDYDVDTTDHNPNTNPRWEKE